MKFLPRQTRLPPRLTLVGLWLSLALGAACREGARQTNVNVNVAAPGATTSPAPVVPVQSPLASTAEALPSPGASPAPPSGATSVSVQTPPRAAAPPEAQTEAPGWRVISVAGEWTLDGSEAPLGRGDSLRAGSTVRLRPTPGRPAYLTLVDGSRTARKVCDPPDACAGGWQVPPAPAAKSTISHVVDTSLDLLSREPHVYINPISRDGGGLREAVLLLGKDGTDLSPAVGRLTPGRHTLKLEPVGRGGSAADARPVELNFRWEFNRAAPLRAEGLRPGLYQLRLDANPPDAWVLVAAPGKYRKASARFREAAALTTRWGEAVDADVARGFLRAYLERLSAAGAGD